MSGSASGNLSKARSKPVDITPLEFKGLRPDIASGLLSLISSQGGQFDGPFAAPIGQQELAAINQIGQAAGPSDADALSRGLLNSTIRGEGLSPDSNPFLQDTIQAAIRPIRQEFEEVELLDRSLFTRAGQQIQDSSPFSRARGIATRGFGDAIGDVATNIAGQNFQRERDRQFGAVEQSANLDRAQFDRLASNLQAQALPRLIEDLGIERGIAEFGRRLDLLRDVLGIGVDASSKFGQESKSFSFGSSMGGGVSAGGGGGGGGGVA